MSFDLNIDNYTKQELASLFDLPPNYDNIILEMKESKLKENIIKNNEISKDTQTKTINFLVKAKNILLNYNPASEKKTPFAIKNTLPLISILLVVSPISKPSLIFLRVLDFLRCFSKEGLK